MSKKWSLKRGLSVLPITAAAALVAGCLGGGNGSGDVVGGNPVNPSEGEFQYDVSITRTTFGVPHIKAADFGSLGFGQGYAFAQDNLCVFLEDLLTIRGERSKFFGPDGTYTIEPNGSTANNVASDFFWKSLFAFEEPGADGVVRNAWQRTRDRTVPDFQNVVKGYTDGVNLYISQLQAGEHQYTQEDGSVVPAHAACRDAQWMQQIEEADLYRRFVRLAVLASSSVFVTEIGNAQPPGGPIPGVPLPLPSGLPSAPGGGGGAPGLPGLDALPLPGLDALPIPGLDALPVPGASAQNAADQKRADALLAMLKEADTPFSRMQNKDRFGSNMYAFGKDATEDGQSLVFGNPHFPWKGTERLYLNHATLEQNGERTIDIMGVGLYGVPAVLIGFNRHVAWSHTVSTAYRFTLYQLTLNPANPTQYLYEGELRDMIQIPTTIEVLQPDGSLSTMERTMYRSHFGPMLVLEVSGVPVLGWNNLMGFSLRDANYENDRLINQFARWNMAKSLEEFIEIQKEVLGVPWVNTVASGPGKPAYYADITVVPHVTDAKVADCKMEPFNTLVGQLAAPGLPVLNGARASCEWGDDFDAPAPGIFGPRNLPSLVRDDYVTNCNDSHWLTNPAQPLTGFARVIGDENAERTLRTRLCIIQAERRLAGADGLEGTRFNQDKLKDIVLNSEIYSATIAKQTVLDTICQIPVVLGTSGMPVQTGEACAALAGWDGKANLDSQGAHLWREFWLRAVGNPAGLPIGLPELHPPLFPNPLPVSLPTNFWVAGFDPVNPVTTPARLNPANPFTLAAFADAITAVASSGFAFDAPLGDIQRSGIHEERIPIFGGESPEGAFTIANNEPIRLSENGYSVTYGNSYIQAVTWRPDGSPKADAMLTYSISTDPANPHFSDYTKAYSQKDWLTLPYTDAEVQASKIGEPLVIRVPKTAN